MAALEGSTEGARGRSKGALREHGGALGRSKRAKGGAAREERFVLAPRRA